MVESVIDVLMILLMKDSSTTWPLLVVNLTVLLKMNRTLTDGNVNVFLVTWEMLLVFVLEIVLCLVTNTYSLVKMMLTLVVVLTTIPMVNLIASHIVLEIVIWLMLKNMLTGVKMVQIIMFVFVRMVGITILWVISTLKE
jgi:hypothetical protein